MCWLISNFLSLQTTCFNNPTLDETILKAMKEAGVHVYSGYYLAQWNDGSADITEITSASFTSNDDPLILECGVSQPNHYTTPRRLCVGITGILFSVRNNI